MSGACWKKSVFGDITEYGILTTTPRPRARMALGDATRVVVMGQTTKIWPTDVCAVIGPDGSKRACTSAEEDLPEGSLTPFNPSDVAASSSNPLIGSLEQVLDWITGNTGKPINEQLASVKPKASGGGNFVPPPSTTGSPAPAAAQSSSIFSALTGPMTMTEKIVLGGAAVGIGYLLYKRSKKGRR